MIKKTKFCQCGYTGTFFGKKCGKCRQKAWNEKRRINAKPRNKARKPTGEKALFLELWNTRPRTSFITGRKINIDEESSLWVSVFAHVLSKGAYVKQRLNPNNIVFLTPQEHRLYDMGTEEQRKKYAEKTGADWKKLYDLKEELRRKHYL